MANQNQQNQPRESSSDKPETILIRLNQSLGGHRTRPMMKDGKPVLKNGKPELEVVGRFTHEPGSVIEWPREEAERMIESGIARRPNKGEIEAAELVS